MDISLMAPAIGVIVSAVALGISCFALGYCRRGLDDAKEREHGKQERNDRYNNPGNGPTDTAAELKTLYDELGDALNKLDNRVPMTIANAKTISADISRNLKQLYGNGS